MRQEEQDVSLLCLDSFVRAETRYVPPVRAVKRQREAMAVAGRVAMDTTAYAKQRILGTDETFQHDLQEGDLQEGRRERERSAYDFDSQTLLDWTFSVGH